MVTVHSPTVEFCNDIRALSIEDPNEMSQDGLPDTQFEFVHEVHNEKGEDVEPKLRKGRDEGVLGRN
jgi:hypothetical protein